MSFKNEKKKHSIFLYSLIGDKKFFLMGGEVSEIFLDEGFDFLNHNFFVSVKVWCFIFRREIPTVTVQTVRLSK